MHFLTGPSKIFIGPRCPWGPIYGPVLSHSLSPRRFANLTDVTLADGDTKSILTDNAKRAIQGNVAMHVTHPVNLVVKFQTSASSVIWWQNLQTM